MNESNVIEEKPYDNVHRHKLFPWIKTSKNQRRLELHKPDQALPSNEIQTSKYTKITFLPLNLFEQFKNPMNLFYLIDGALSMIPNLSNSNGIPSLWITLFIVVIITGVKDYLQDQECKKNDEMQNNSQVQVCVDGQWTLLKWKQLYPGMMVRIKSGEKVPADLLLVKCAVGGSLQLDTRNLDGQTNLKFKHSIKLDNLDSVVFQGPNQYLYKFRGKAISSTGQTDFLTNENILLRNTIMRGQQYSDCLILYTGLETKIMLNNQGNSFKLAKVQEKARNILRFLIFLIFFLALLAAAFCTLITKNNLPYLAPVQTDGQFFLVKMIGWILLMDNILSITVTVALAVSRKIYSIWMQNDPQLKKSQVNNSSIIDNLGQVQFILSDKTGTLTKNCMKLKAIFLKDQTQETLDLTVDDNQVNILLAMATCHEVNVKDGTYNSPSQEQLCFVTHAREQGYQYIGFNRQDNQDNYCLMRKGQLLSFPVLALFPFDFNRKRQTIVLKIKDKIVLFIKGAQATVFPLMKSKDQKPLQQAQILARKGLRPMMFGYKELKDTQFSNWHSRYKELQSKLNYNEQELNLLKEQLQTNLQFMAIVGLQDQMQDNLLKTIGQIQGAGINFWIVTGDRYQPVKKMIMQTNLSASMHILECSETLFQESSLQDRCLLISGQQVQEILANQQFRETVELNRISTAIFYRCSPVQKKQIADFLKASGKCVLCIGDGDNDINMIKTAHVGVAVRGVQGSLALGACDVALDNFSQLSRALFVHGRESYRRNSILAYMMISRNMFVGLTQFFYGFTSNFSASPFFESYVKQIYNLAMTLPPTVHFALYDEEYSPDILLKEHGQLYSLGLNSKLSDFWTDLQWSLISVAIPCSAFFLTTFANEQLIYFDLQHGIQLESSYVNMCILVIFSNYKMGFQLSHKVSVMSIVEFILGVGLVLLSYLAIPTFTTSFLYGYDYMPGKWRLYFLIAYLSGMLIVVDMLVRRGVQGTRWFLRRCC